MFRTFVALLLVPLLAAAPPSVEKLLRRPRPGPVLLHLNNGSTAEGDLVRMTDQFVAIRHLRSCQQVQLSEVRKIDRLTSPRNFDVGIVIGLIVTSPVWAPMLAWWVIHDSIVGDPSLSIAGNWQSDQGTILSINGMVGEKREISRTKGTYMLGGQILALDDRKTLDANFECDTLNLTDNEATQRLRSRRWASPATAPIVGDWYGVRPTDPDSWAFHEDGTYQLTQIVSALRGDVAKSGTGFLFTWADGSQSTAARHGKILTLTTNGGTERYQEKPQN